MRKFVWIVIGLFIAGTAGCVDSARIRTDDEAGIIDQKRGGIAVYDNIVRGALEKLLKQHHDKIMDDETGKFLVAFVGIDNKGAEELGDHEEAIYDSIEEVLVNAKYYDVVSKRFIDVARRASGIRGPEDIFLAEPQQRFLSVLKQDGLSPSYFIWGKMTTQTSTHKGMVSKKKDRRYRFSMEMVDTSTGQVVSKVSESNIKAYKKY